MLDQQVHMVTTMKELHYNTKNFVQVDGDYLGDEGPLRQSMDI